MTESRSAVNLRAAESAQKPFPVYDQLRERMPLSIAAPSAPGTATMLLIVQIHRDQSRQARRI